MNKGRGIFVEGRLKLDQWETPAGEKRSKLRVSLENFQFVGGRGEEDGVATSGDSFTSTSQDPAPKPNEEASPSSPSKEVATENKADIEEDDVPF